MTETVQNPFLQLLSIGFVWIFIHCSPMCGPIISGLQIGRGIKGGAWKGLLYYQLGRGSIYLLFGALAGFFGSEQIISSQNLGWAVVGVLTLMTLTQFFPRGLRLEIPIALMNLWTRIASRTTGPARPLVLGVLLAFLPCMLAFWVLSLAAATQSASKGALLMGLLVLMTSLPLLTAAIGSEWCSKQIRRIRLTPWLLLISTLWTVLVTLASQHTIEHQHLVFEVLGINYTLMFW